MADERSQSSVIALLTAVVAIIAIALRARGGEDEEPEPTPEPPVAEMSVETDGLSVTVDVSGSSDPDGEIESAEVAWGDGDVDPTSGGTASHTYDSDGEYTITATVTDSDGLTDTDQRTVEVTRPNQSPNAEMSVETDGLIATVDPSSTSDPDGRISEYEVEWGDPEDTVDRFSSAQNVSFEYPEGGEYTITLTVTDNDGSTDDTSQTVSVSTPVDSVEFQFASLTTDYTNYTVEVDAESEPAVVREDSDLDDRWVSEDNDTVTELDNGNYLIEGQTGTPSGEEPALGDTFRWETRASKDWGIVDFDYTGAVEADITVLINGSDVNPSDLPGGGDAGGSVSEIGGGSEYPGTTYTESDADHVATTRGELHSALDSATSGDVVYVPGDAEIHANTDTFNVPNGVTLASGRGLDGSPGGLVYETNDNNGLRMIKAGDNAVVTGLRIRGPHHDQESPGTAWDHGHIGIRFIGDGGEVANCEVAGWGYAGIDDHNGHLSHVHHCHIHHNANNGLGYGIQTFTGQDTLIERNLFGRNRHCIVGQGGASYTAQNNIVEENQRHHAFDHHSTGGTVIVRNNEFRMLPGTVDIMPSAYRQRGDASDTRIYRNWAYNDNGESGDDDATWYVSGGNYEIRDNHLGESQPPSGIGIDLSV